jgi:hypothetical protein
VRRTVATLASLSGLLAALGPSCGGIAATPTGGLRQSCFGDGTCSAGFACVSGVCVAPPGADSGAGSSSGSNGSSGSTGSSGSGSGGGSTSGSGSGSPDASSQDSALDAPSDGSDSGSPDTEAPDSAADATGDAISCTGTPPAPNATAVSNPVPTQTTTATGVVLHMALDGFGNYGTTGASDIVYEGQVGAWTFAVPNVTIKSASVVASMVADDHGTPISEYSFALWSADCEYSGVALPHGSPFASIFTDWVAVNDQASLTAGATYTVTIDNTSTTGSSTDWIAVEWIELRITTQ